MSEEVFKVVNFKEDGKIELSDQFLEKLKESKNPFIVTFIGETRSGKSSRLNYLIKGKTKLTEPFNAQGGFQACTEGISGYGPLSFHEFDSVFQLFDDERFNTLNPDFSNTDESHENIPQIIQEKINNRDIFLINCEGTGSIDKTTNGLNNALALLVQISSVITFVSKNPSDSSRQYYENVMQFSKELQTEDIQLNKAAVIMFREIVDELNPDDFEKLNTESLSKFDFYETLRKDQDNRLTEKFLGRITSKGTNFNESMLKLFVQPDWNITENFHESMRDYVFFIFEIAMKLAFIDSEAVLSIANLTLAILNNSNLDDILPFDVMLTKYLLNKLLKSIILRETNNLEKEIIQKPYQEFISMDINQLYDDAIKKIENMFESEVNQQQPNCISNFPDLFKEIKSTIPNYFEKIRIFEMIHKKGDSTRIIEEASHYSLEVMNQKILTQILSLNEGNVLNFDISKFVHVNAANLVNELNHCFEKYWPSFIENKAIENLVKQISMQNELFAKGELTKQVEKVLPKTVLQARKAGQKGSTVRLWHDQKFIEFQVDKNDHVIIPNISVVKRSHKYFITDGDYSSCHVHEKNVGYDFNFEKMALSIHLNSVITKKGHWTRSYWYSLRTSHKNEHYVRELTIKLGGNFTFLDGTTIMCIKSPPPPGGNGNYYGETPVPNPIILAVH